MHALRAALLAAAPLVALLRRSAASRSPRAGRPRPRPAFQPRGRRAAAAAFACRGGASRRVATAARLASTDGEAGRPVPIVLLAGFLGSGKTSALKHLLENNSNVKIGIIVNEVASVNIDAKLLSNTDHGDAVLDAHAEGVVELENGCACCSLADELFASVVRLTRGGTRPLDAIVVELSGVADPVAVRQNWEEAALNDYPATRLATLSRTVTLVDACTFGTDFMTWDKAGERPAWTSAGDAAAARHVPELLAEQVEAADLLLVNKVDLAGQARTAAVCGVARGLNGRAPVREVEFGRVGARELLGSLLEDAGAAEDEEEDEEEDCRGHEHSHGHSAAQDHEPHAQVHPPHDHGHNHDDEASADTAADCAEASHSHHEHDAVACTDSSHSHSHDHASECDDAECTDASHSHSHEHRAPQAENHLNITSFVYSSPVPFDSHRLLELLNRWPIPIKDSLDVGAEGEGAGEAATAAPGQHAAFAGVLRSKGFCWMAPARWSAGPGCDAWRHDTAMLWSHAGKHFGLKAERKWWGALGRAGMEAALATRPEERARVLREDWASEEWGDRRQELVFIGRDLDEGEIRAALDACLCTEEEMVAYRASLRSYREATRSVA